MDVNYSAATTLCDVWSAIGGSIVSDNDFDFAPVALACQIDAVQQTGQYGLLVIGRNYKRDVRHSSCLTHSASYPWSAENVRTVCYQRGRTRFQFGSTCLR